MEMTEPPKKFCRICLVPEEGKSKFMEIFENNARIALKIYNFAGILMMNIDKDVPSLICQKCIDDIEAAENLKMRMLDADDYYTMMTQEKEINFLRADVKELIHSKTSTSKKRSRKSMTDTSIMPEVKVMLKRQSLDAENRNPLENSVTNSNPRKRKLENECEETLAGETTISEQTPKTPRKAFIPKATPNKLGIHRMVIKTQKSFVSAKSKIAAIFTPEPDNASKQKEIPSKKSSKQSSKKSAKSVSARDSSGKSTARKKPFVPKLFVNRPSKSKKAQSAEQETKKITFECDDCQETFESVDQLNQHILTHNDEPESELINCASCDETFSNIDCLVVHRKTCRLDGASNKTAVTVTEA